MRRLILAALLALCAAPAVAQLPVFDSMTLGGQPTAPLPNTLNLIDGSIGFFHQPNGVADPLSWRLYQRPGLATVPTPTFYPSTTLQNSIIALDVLPKGTPADSLNGVAWLDAPCNQDFVGNPAVQFNCLHLGAHPGSLIIASHSFTGAPDVPIIFAMGAQSGGNAEAEYGRLDVNHNWGFGQSNPREKVDVGGNIRFGLPVVGVAQPAYVAGAPSTVPNTPGANVSINASSGTGAQPSGSVSICTVPANSLTVIPATFDVASSATPASGSSLTWSHTTGALAHGILVVSVGYNAATTQTTNVIYNGVALTRLATSHAVNTASGWTAELWYLLAPPSGAHNIVVTSSVALVLNGIGTSYDNVDQSNPFGATLLANGLTGTTTGSEVIATTSGEWIVDVLSKSLIDTPAPSGSQTSNAVVTNANTTLGSSRQTAAGPTATGSWSWSNSATWVYAAASMRAFNSATAAPCTNAVTVNADGSVTLAGNVTGPNVTPALPAFRPGSWYSPAATAVAAGALSANTIFGIPIQFRRPATLKTFTVNVTTGIAAGFNVAMGLYTESGGGTPGTLVTGTDTGAIAIGANATGQFTGTLGGGGVAVPAGLYWIALVADTTGSQVSFAQGQFGPLCSVVGGGSAAALFTASTCPTGVNKAQTFGALPGTFPASSSRSGAPYLVLGF